MTRLLCLGDQQLGVTTVDLQDQEAVWDRIVDLAIGERVDGVLHGGDLFEHARPYPEVLAAFRRPYSRLREAGIPMLLIRGNGTHDGASREVDALDVLREYPGLTVSTLPEVHAVAGVVVCTLPWVSPARLVAQQDGAVDRDRLNEIVAWMLVDIASDLEERARRDHPGLPVILLGHWSVSGSSLPTGLPVDQLREPVLEIADLEALGFDAMVFAHIHEPQALGASRDRHLLFDAETRSTHGNATAFYVGSPQPLNFGEATSPHGVWILDTEPANGCRSTFVPIRSRPFVTVDVGDLTHSGDPLGLIQQTYERVDTDHAIVRVRYQLTEAQARLFTQNLIRGPLIEAGAHRVSIEPQIVRESRARAATLHADLGPLEALRLYCEAQSVEPLLAGRMGERLRAWIEA